MIVKELITKLRFKVDPSGRKKYEKGLKRTAKTAEQMAKKQRRSVKRITQSFKSAGSKISSAWTASFNRMLSKQKSHASKSKSMAMQIKSAYSGVFKNIATGMAGFGAGYLGFQALQGGLTRLVKVGSETEQVFSQLATLRGPNQARRDVQEINKFAAKTPFTFQQIASSFAKLNAAGFKVDLNSMQKLGDIAAGSNKTLEDLTNTMLSASRGQGAMVDNFNGMAGAAKNGGLELSAYDSKTKKTIKTMVKAGDKASLLAFYLKAAERQDTEGAMVRLSTTLQGLGSTLTDNVDAAFRTFYNAGFGKALKLMTTAAIGFMQNALIPMARNAGVFIGLNLPGIVEKITFGFKLLGPAVKLTAIATGILLTRMIGLKAIAIASFVFQAVTAFRAMTLAQTLAAAAGWALNAAVMAIPIAIGAVIVGVGLLAYDTYTFFTTGESMLLSWTEQWPLLHSMIENAMIFVAALAMGFTDLGQKWTNTINLMMEMFNKWKQNVTNTINYIKEMFFSAFNSIKDFIFGVIATLIEKFNQLKEIGSTVGTAIANGLKLALNPLNALVSGAKSLWSWFSKAGSASQNIKPPAKGGGAAPGKSRGGIIPGGYPNDSYPMFAESGEMVISKRGVNMINRGQVSQGLNTVPGFHAPGAVGTQTVAQNRPQYMAGGGTSNTFNNSISQQFTVTVSGSNSSAYSIAKSTGAEALDGTRRALDMVRRSYPVRVGASA